MSKPDLRYPIGRFEWDGSSTPSDRRHWINQIADLPVGMHKAVKGLTIEQLDTPYRPKGWTVRQVVHHVADSHMNSFIRFKLALTEDTPTIRPYLEAKWAKTADSNMSIEPSLAVIEGLHQRWIVLLASLSKRAFARAFQHPEAGLMTLDKALALYAWHGRHHVRHIADLRKRMRW
ncbi:MAG: putative metal-dependent hydrolase [Bryobacteraceae bacterium]